MDAVPGAVAGFPGMADPPDAPPRYACDRCGACCKGGLIVEADELDVLREPRIIESDPHWRDRTAEAVLHELRSEFGKAVVLACSRPCTFLGSDNLCTIYPTRPNVCVGMEAGDEQCQAARLAAGLAPLAPIA
jgi:Fe-S-cluster containining protein